ncbi:MAG: hypothetical protein KBD01_09275 [Acidobacteria bacterium]|nr:hypothetical protein [Acidobacteriota bacterium]
MGTTAESPKRKCRRFLRSAAMLLAIAALCGLAQREALSLSISVQAPDGTPVGGFRYLVQEDTTYGTLPGTSCMPGQDPEQCHSLGFHRSYARVVKAGSCTGSPCDAGTLSAGRYFVSVLPDNADQDDGFANGGAGVRVVSDPGATLTITVQRNPIPTAQIRVFVFEDNFPINNAPDTPAEVGLPDFEILVFDAAGRFGAAGGQITQDAFGNPLGTTYDANGGVIQLGSGRIWSGADGYAVVPNVAPGKYGIQVVPPSGQGWQQTATIEGTKTVDAWVKAGEPPYFVEFGPPGPHVFIGFLRAFHDASVLDGPYAVRGQIRAIHNSRPPDFTFYTGAPVPSCWVGINQGVGGVGRGLAATPCNEDSTFEITGLPPGDYGLAIWDANLDFIFAVQNFTVTDSDVDLLDVPVFDWFFHLHASVFDDIDRDGFPDPGEAGLPNIPVNLRWRDGTIYQSAPTDLSGEIPFDEVFPFFNWLVAEVDYTRLEATGATIVIDGGGPVNGDMGWDYPSDDRLNPQPQCSETLADGTCIGPLHNIHTGNNLSRTITSAELGGPVLLEGFQGFMGQTSKIAFGKAPWGPGQNGGISGVVQYATTRAEQDPQLAVAELWEPGVPRVQINLYRDHDRDGTIDDLTVPADGAQLADSDNYPFGFADGSAGPGAEDLDRDGDGTFDPGDALQIVWSDSWDDGQPTGCQGETFYADGVPRDCYDGLRNFNQVREGVFDGGWAFMDYVPGGMQTGGEAVPLIADTYIVEAVAPPGYEHVKEEDKNVDFGLPMQPDPQALPPACVGDPHLVPDTYSLFPLVDDNGQNVPPYRAGTSPPLCDRKQVPLRTGQNAPVNFFLFTHVPIAGHLTGFILDDLSNEFDPSAPTFGEKYSPPYLPVSLRDWTGREFGRVYSDRWGSYNGLVPSTFSANLPMASGMSPAMFIACMNSPGPIANPDYDGTNDLRQFITDPHYQKHYSQFCYTFQYMPGTTTYLDTPVVPVAAFAGPSQFPFDCEFTDGTPGIYTASGPMGGPYAATTGVQITITSLGLTEVPNPEYDGTNNSKTLMRDFGFGDTPGVVRIGTTQLTIDGWSDGAITATIPAGTKTGQLSVERGDNHMRSVVGVTFTIGPLTLPGGGEGTVRYVNPDTTGWPAHPLQDAIDAAAPGDLILVAPGIYEELVVMHKPVRLQGWGPFAVTINAVKAPGEKLQAWRDKLRSLIDGGFVDLLPSQEVGWDLPEPSTFMTEEGPGIIVVAKNSNQLSQGGFVSAPNARIDGFGITGADTAGGIFVNGYARFLEVSNNRIFGNSGTWGGGIRVGFPFNTIEDPNGQIDYDDANNRSLNIHHNMVVGNGGQGAAGGGISLFTGSDNYRVTSNWVCGNFSMGEGGGVGHYGESRNGRISENTIIFNESFNQGVTVNGGGVFIGGGDPLNGPGSLTPGAGSTKVISNLIQGNLAGAGDGGGIRLQRINGLDVERFPNAVAQWHNIEIYNNIIVNNIATLAGGGISLQDAARVSIINDTIQNNESTGTAGEAFLPGSPNVSSAQPAGIVARAHSPELAAEFGNLTRALYGEFSNPALANSIVRHNRKFYFLIDPVADPPLFGLVPDLSDPLQVPVWDDLAVLGTATQRYLSPQYCLLSEDVPAGLYASNNIMPAGNVLTGNAEYFNGNRGQTIQQPEAKTSITAAPAFDEGGNFINIRFGPLTLTRPRLLPTDPLLPYGDYHLNPGSPAINAGPSGTSLNADLRRDFDNDQRPYRSGATTTRIDIGADETPVLTPAPAPPAGGMSAGSASLWRLLPGSTPEVAAQPAGSDSSSSNPANDPPAVDGTDSGIHPQGGVPAGTVNDAPAGSHRAKGDRVPSSRKTKAPKNSRKGDRR